MTRAGLGDFTGALADYDAAIRLIPQDAEPHLYRGFANEKKGDLRAALEDYTHALRLSPENGAVYYHRAWVRDKLGDAGGAAADYTEAIRCGGDYTTDCYYRRGQARFKLGDYDGAAADFGVSLHDVDANFVNDSLRGLGSSYDALQRPAEALKYYHDYLQRAAPYADSAITRRVAELEQQLKRE
jgi:tetratricopeptide (TPR) repeat protein